MIEDAEYNKVVLSRDAALTRAASREAQIGGLLRGAQEALAGQPVYIRMARERLDAIKNILEN